MDKESGQEAASARSHMEITKAQMEAIDAHMINGIFSDYANSFQSIYYACTTKDTSLLKPLLHYEEYYKSIEDRGYTPARTTYLLSKSDAQRCRELNGMIDEFNSNLERVKDNFDWDYLGEMYKRLYFFVNGSEFTLI